MGKERFLNWVLFAFTASPTEQIDRFEQDKMMAREQKIVTPYDDLTYKVIGCAMAVHRKIGPGLREDTYQRDLEVQLLETGLAFEALAKAFAEEPG